MADISTPNSRSMDILSAIIEHGPLSLYVATQKTRISIGTIHRHFKQLSEEKKIRVYSSNKKGRKKIEYGPTIHGMVHLYRQNPEFAKQIENYYLLWIDNPEFQKELSSEGFDINIENLKKSKKIFRKYMDYFSAIEEKIQKIREGEDVFSHQLQVFLGSVLLSSNPKYQKLLTELYLELPGMQKSLNQYVASLQSHAVKLKEMSENIIRKQNK